MNSNYEFKKEAKEFVEIALELRCINPNLFEGYKNRMIGAIEVQKLLESKEGFKIL